MINEFELNAYCGLFCGDCIRYRMKASDLSAELLGELETIDFEQYARIKSSPEKQLDPVKQFSD